MIASRRIVLAGALASLLSAPAIAQPVPDVAQKVEILLDWKALPTFAGFYLAREMGAFERRGLEVTFSETQGLQEEQPRRDRQGTGTARTRSRATSGATAAGRR